MGKKTQPKERNSTPPAKVGGACESESPRSDVSSSVPPTKGSAGRSDTVLPKQTVSTRTSKDASGPEKGAETLGKPVSKVPMLDPDEDDGVHAAAQKKNRTRRNIKPVVLLCDSDNLLTGAPALTVADVSGNEVTEIEDAAPEKGDPNPQDAVPTAPSSFPKVPPIERGKRCDKSYSENDEDGRKKQR